jgi:glycosyltransferase involved in cell wall biosynthesis
MTKVAVITPYYKEPTAMLKQAHESVLIQKGAEIDHFMIADGFANSEISSWKAKHIILPQAHADNGNTPRGIGSLLAEVEGYDFIAYLDADNWFHEGHIESLLKLHEKTNANICSSFRTFHSLDGSNLNITEKDENDLVHIDTSCMLLSRKAFCILNIWMQMPKQLSPICDRVFLSAIRSKDLTIQSTKLRTLAFRSQYEFHFRAAKMPIPDGIKNTQVLKPSYDYLLTRDGIDSCVKRMGFWPLTYMSKK